MGVGQTGLQKNSPQEIPLLCLADYGANVLRYLLPFEIEFYAAKYPKIKSNPVTTYLFQDSSVEKTN